MKRSAFIFCLAITLALAINAVGQQREASRPVQMDEVIRMSKAGIADDIIISRIDRKVELTTDQLIELKNSGVSDRIIRWMTNRLDSSDRTTLPVVGGEISEVGFYLINDKQTVALTSSAFTTQKAGMARWVVTSGFSKIKQKASLPGASASIRTNNRKPGFLFYGPEGVAASDYVLVRLDKKKDNREITVGKSSILGSSVGFEKERIINISSNKLATRQWQISLDAPLQPGEYAFYPAGGIQPSGFGVSVSSKLYEFGID